MSENTTISYADHTWSPWEGCEKISEGCRFCFAEALNHRFGKDNWGHDKPRRLTKDWGKPVKWNKRLMCDCGCIRPPVNDAVFYPPCPKCKSTYGPARVLVSMCDPFDLEVPTDWWIKFFDLVVSTERLEWLLLTKRPENINRRIQEYSDHWQTHLSGMPKNVWLGVSVENQEMADKRIPILLSIRARVRWVSAEPLLGPVNLGLIGTVPKDISPAYRHTSDMLHLVVVGGESGRHARPMKLEWLTSIVHECHVTNTACWVKQDSAFAPGQQGRIPDSVWAIKQFPEL